MDDLISEFITETAESLSILDQELVRLEQNPDDPDLLGSIFRIMHTIKGTCGFLGLPRLEHVAHAAENVLGKVRDKEIEITPEIVSLILEALDTIKVIMDHLEAQGEEPAGDDSDLTHRLNVKAGMEADDAAEVADEEEVPAAAAEPEQPEPDEFDFVPVRAEDTGKDTAAAEEAKLEEKAEEKSAKEVTPAGVSPEAQKEAVEQGIAAAEKGMKKPAAAAAAGSNSQSIRVNLDVLETLMQMVSELVLTRNQLLQLVRDRNDSEFITPLQRLSHITTELQEGVMKTRMQPIGNAWAKFPRLVRDLAHDLNKKIELRMVGAETELDRQLLEMIKDPLTHMVRNSADHGLEKPEDRKKAGKSEMGTITLSAYHEGGHIIIEIRDDGKGINTDVIKAKAIKNGLTTEAEASQLSDQQILQFIFRPGFSTAEQVTSVSGRGVGMDVVKTNIEKIGGTVLLQSTLGQGSTFTIKIPLTLAIVSVMVVETEGQRFAIPQICVEEMVRASRNSEHVIEMINDTPVLRLRKRLLPLISLSHLLGLRNGTDHLGGADGYIVVCTVGNYRFGVVVDRVFDTEEIVVKPVSPLIKGIDVYSGSTILGDGSVIMIIDPNGVARRSGQADVRQAPMPVETARHYLSDRLTGFLLFHAGSTSPKAVPLELVSRLEEVQTSAIEYSSGAPVVQYRNRLMRLVTLDGMALPSEQETLQVIVFSYENKNIGLVVDSILDIVDEKLDIKLSSSREGYLGSMVIHDRTTDVIDAGHLLSSVLADLSDSHSDEEQKHYDLPRLLLVDDSAFFRNLTAPFLSASGYHVVTSASGVDAFKMLQDGITFDVVVTDIEMPGMSGYEFIENARANGVLKENVPVIACTGKVSAGTEEKAKNHGILHVIAKTDRQGLVAVIRTELQKAA